MYVEIRLCDVCLLSPFRSGPSFFIWFTGAICMQRARSAVKYRCFRICINFWPWCDVVLSVVLWRCFRLKNSVLLCAYWFTGVVLLIPHCVVVLFLKCRRSVNVYSFQSAYSAFNGFKCVQMTRGYFKL